MAGGFDSGAPPRVGIEPPARGSLSPAIESIMEEYRRIRENLVRVLQVSKKARVDEVDSYAKLELEKAKAFIKWRDEGFAVKEAESHRDIDVNEFVIKYKTAQTIRGAANDSIRVWEKELEVLSAALHAHNREMKQ